MISKSDYYEYFMLGALGFVMMIFILFGYLEKINLEILILATASAFLIFGIIALICRIGHLINPDKFKFESENNERRDK